MTVPGSCVTNHSDPYDVPAEAAGTYWEQTTGYTPTTNYTDLEWRDNDNGWVLANVSNVVWYLYNPTGDQVYDGSSYSPGGVPDLPDATGFECITISS